MLWGSNVEAHLHDPCYSMTERFFNSCYKWRSSFVIGTFANTLLLKLLKNQDAMTRASFFCFA